VPGLCAPGGHVRGKPSVGAQKPDARTRSKRADGGRKPHEGKRAWEPSRVHQGVCRFEQEESRSRGGAGLRAVGAVC
jgi:hypothetical protein